MTELEKLKAGLQYCYDDEEVDALKEQGHHLVSEVQRARSSGF